MIKIDSIKISAKHDTDPISYAVKKYGIRSEIKDYVICRKSIDARDKNDIRFVYSIALSLSEKEERFLTDKFKNISLYNEKEYKVPSVKNSVGSEDTVIVGMGPAGLFCALVLSEAGLKPVIIDKGKCVEERIKDVENFFNEGNLNVFSNVQFGEGGAGTFSDGKLNTGIKDSEGRKEFVLKTFVKYGAPENIMYDAKPHIGTDVLRTVIINIREELKKRDVKVLFSKEFVSFKEENGKLKTVTVKDVYSKEEEILNCKNAVLAIGHSSRNTFEYLSDKVPMEIKPFAMGFRVIHSQSFIDKSQYGENFEQLYENLEASTYKLTHNGSERGVYSFCMCPGGFVVNASSEKKRVCINGMSNNKRDSGFANSAVIVQINKEDLNEEDVLSGVKFQREIEEKTFLKGNGSIPLSDLKTFYENNSYGFDFKFKDNAVNPEEAVKGRFVTSDISDIYPDYINKAFCEAMADFDHIIKGFATENPLILASETRSSSPVRILRNEDLESSIKGIYPCGEGAGYAGGIVSAAVDGIKVAESIISSLNG